MGCTTGIFAGRNSRKWKCHLMQHEDGNRKQRDESGVGWLPSLGPQEDVTAESTQGGACANLAGKRDQGKDSRQVLQQALGRDRHIFSRP